MFSRYDTDNGGRASDVYFFFECTVWDADEGDCGYEGMEWGLQLGSTIEVDCPRCYSQVLIELE